MFDPDPTLVTLLQATVNSGSSDLHLTVGRAPTARRDGTLVCFENVKSLEPNDTDPMSADAFFRGQPVSGKMIGPATRVPGCWGSGGGAGTVSSTTQLRAYRADIIRNFAQSTFMSARP